MNTNWQVSQLVPFFDSRRHRSQDNFRIHSFARGFESKQALHQFSAWKGSCLRCRKSGSYCFLFNREIPLLGVPGEIPNLWWISGVRTSANILQFKNLHPVPCITPSPRAHFNFPWNWARVKISHEQQKILSVLQNQFQNLVLYIYNHTIEAPVPTRISQSPTNRPFTWYRTLCCTFTDPTLKRSEREQGRGRVCFKDFTNSWIGRSIYPSS